MRAMLLARHPRQGGALESIESPCLRTAMSRQSIHSDNAPAAIGPSAPAESATTASIDSTASHTTAPSPPSPRSCSK